MIIEYDFAKDLLEEIESELNKHENEVGILITKKHSTLNIDYDWIYNSQIYCLPIYTSETTDIIQISNYYFEIYFNGIKEKHPKLVENGVENAIESEMNNCYPPSSIYTAIYDKISNLIFNYKKVLETTRENDNLHGILNEEKLLINHLNKYYEILQSNTKQIQFLRGIVLNKVISDLILKIYTRFIHLRLSIINPKIFAFENEPHEIQTSKLVWLGSQKELCELFIQLQEKEWIEEIKYGKINKTAKAICNLFDLTLTQRDSNSDIENSFYQILKGKNNHKTKRREYDDVFGNKYKFSFKGIRKNGG